MNLNRPNHVLRPRGLKSSIDQHVLIFYDVESYEERDTRIQYPYLMCYEVVVTDRNYKVVRQESGHLLWEHIDNFVDLVMNLRKLNGYDITLYAHNHHYDLFVNSGEVVHEITEEDLVETYGHQDFKRVHDQCLFERFVNKGLRNQDMSLKPPRFLNMSKEEDVRMRGTVREVQNSVMFIDTMNYFKMNLASIGESIGYVKTELDHHIDRRGDQLLIDEAVTYCMRDVKILVISVLQLLTATSQGQRVPLSTPSASFNLYTTKYLKKLPPIYCHDKKKVLALEFKCYKGARTEVIRQGKVAEEIYSIDVNNLYGFAMRDNPYPHKLIGSSGMVKGSNKVKSIELLGKRLLNNKNIGICANVLVNIPQEYRIAPLPLTLYQKNSRENRLLYPTGQFMTYLSTPEFLLAYQNGWIEEIYEYSTYEMAYIFKEFMEDMYQIRLKAKEEQNNLQDFIYKLIPNSLAGKFGQKYRRLIKIEDTYVKYDSHFEKDENGDRKEIKTFGYSSFYTEEDKIAFDAFPAISAHVNSHARVIMWNYIEKIGHENIVYIDNDGLKVTKQGYENIKDDINELELGKFKLEYRGNIEVFSSKDYISTNVIDSNGNPLEDIKRQKGIKPNAKPLGSLLYEQDRFPTPYDIMRTGEVVATKIIKTNIKQNLEIHGRNIDNKGWTMPLHMQSDQYNEKRIREDILPILGDKKRMNQHLGISSDINRID